MAGTPLLRLETAKNVGDGIWVSYKGRRTGRTIDMEYGRVESGQYCLRYGWGRPVWEHGTAPVFKTFSTAF